MLGGRKEIIFMSIASYFEGIQDARGEPEKEQPYLTAWEWLEEVRPHLDEIEKSLSEKELLDRVENTLKKCACLNFSRNYSRRMWKVFATKIEFTPDEKAKASEFAKQEVPDMSNDFNDPPDVHERKIRIGKLGEVAFAEFLRANGKKSNEDMFTGWMSWQTSTGKTIDVITPSEENHIRILVRRERYEKQPKDYYVGVKISADEGTAKVIGFAAYQELTPFNYGRHPAYAAKLDSLHSITELIDMMDNA